MSNEDPRDFFSRSILEKSLMTPEQEKLVREKVCPKCHGRLTRTSEGGGVCFSQCVGCGDIWVVQA